MLFPEPLQMCSKQFGRMLDTYRLMMV